MAKSKGVYVCICTGSDGDLQIWLPTKRQFNAMGNAPDPLQWIIDGGDKRDKSMPQFESLKSLYQHMHDNNLVIEDEIAGFLY